jgi:hypothetical protein
MLVQRSYRGASPMQEVEKRAQLCGVRVFRARSLSRVWLVRVDPVGWSKHGGPWLGSSRAARRRLSCLFTLRTRVVCHVCVDCRVCGAPPAPRMSRGACVCCARSVCDARHATATPPRMKKRKPTAHATRTHAQNFALWPPGPNAYGRDTRHVVDMVGGVPHVDARRTGRVIGRDASVLTVTNAAASQSHSQPATVGQRTYSQISFVSQPRMRPHSTARRQHIRHRKHVKRSAAPPSSGCRPAHPTPPPQDPISPHMIRSPLTRSDLPSLVHTAISANSYANWRLEAPAPRFCLACDTRWCPSAFSNVRRA